MNNNNEENILQVQHLQKKYGDHTVLKDISFDINKGEVMTIIGPSGGGKSTMLRCINLLEEPSNGKILFLRSRRPNGVLKHMRQNSC